MLCAETWEFCKLGWVYLGPSLKLDQWNLWNIQRLVHNTGAGLGAVAEAMDGQLGQHGGYGEAGCGGQWSMLDYASMLLDYATMHNM